MRRGDVGWLLGFFGVSFGAAGVGSAFTIPALDPWYRGLRKPSWTPPDRAFGPVWTILYAHVAIAGWLIYRGTSRQRPERRRLGRTALVAWATQLVLNVAWSAAFFGRRSPAGGLLVIGLLCVAIATTVLTALRVSRLAGLLLLPYLAWTGFAAALNVRVWQLNSGRADVRA